MNNLTKAIALSVALPSATFAFVASAQEYTYVDTASNLRVEEANGPMQAIAQAEDIHPRSGVVEGRLDANTTSDGETYLYINTEGELRSTVSTDPMIVINTAEDIHPRSGVVEA